MAQLIYYCGTMDSGKSTLALQTAHNYESRGRHGLVFTNQDRAGTGIISSRLGLQSPAIEVSTGMDIFTFVSDHQKKNGKLDYLIFDEAQFPTGGLGMFPVPPPSPVVELPPQLT